MSGTLSCLRMELTQIWPDLRTYQPPTFRCRRLRSRLLLAKRALKRATIGLSNLMAKPAAPQYPSTNDSGTAGQTDRGLSKAPDTDPSPIAPSDLATMGQRDTEGPFSSGIG